MQKVPDPRSAAGGEVTVYECLQGLESVLPVLIDTDLKILNDSIRKTFRRTASSSIGQWKQVRQLLIDKLHSHTVTQSHSYKLHRASVSLCRFESYNTETDIPLPPV